MSTKRYTGLFDLAERADKFTWMWFRVVQVRWPRVKNLEVFLDMLKLVKRWEIRISSNMI